MASPKPLPPPSRPSGAPSAGDADLLALHHWRVGWWSIAVFGTIGLALETLHGFKVGAYLDASNETRRLMWTLAHAHGTLLGLMHVAFAATVRTGIVEPAGAHLASKTLTGALALLPAGFFLGGVRFYAADPGIGIVIVPIGAVLLIAAAMSTARGLTRRE